MRERLNAIKSRPVRTDWPAVYDRVAKTLKEFPGATIAILTHGLAVKDDKTSFATLLGQNPSNVVWVQPMQLDPIALASTYNESRPFHGHGCLRTLEPSTLLSDHRGI